MKELFNFYLRYSKKTKAKGTYDYEVTICSYLIRYFKNMTIAELDIKSIHNFVLYLKGTTSLANISINKCIKLLKSMIEFSGYYLPWLQNYKLLKEEKRRFSLLSEQEIEIVFNYVDNLECRGNGSQYRLMMYLLYDTGVRQAELLNIKLPDINLKKRCILIKARKSSFDRNVFLSNKVLNILKKHTIRINKHDLLFYNHLRNREFNRNDLKLFYRRIKESTGIKRLHSHMFRHSYATDLIELEVPLFVVQQQLGHSSITTTQIYYHANFKYQEKEMMKIAAVR